MKKTRFFVAFTLILMLLAAPFTALAGIPTEPMPAFYVNDFADVISEADEAEMLALGTALEDACGAQVVVATVEWLDGIGIDQYGYDMLSAWKLGSESKIDGVLLLLSVGDREVGTTVGEGLIKSLTSSVTGAYTDEYAMSYLGKNDYSSGLRENYRALVSKVASINGISMSQLTQPNVAPDGSSYGYDNPQYNYEYSNNYSGGNTSMTSWGGGFLMELIIAIIVLIVIFSIVRSLFRASGNAPGCLFGWMLGRSTRPRGWGGWGWGGHHHHPPHHHHGPTMGPRPKPPGGRSTGGFGGGGFGGGGGGFGGGGRSGGGGGRSGGGGGRVGGGGGRPGGGSSRKF